MTRDTLRHKGVGHGVAHHDLSTGDMGCLLRVVGVLVGHVDHQRASRLRHGGDVETDVGAIAVLAVDAYLSGHGHVQLHLVGGREAQCDGQRLVLFQCGQAVAGQRLDEVGQREADLACIAAALVGHLYAVLTALALDHRGDDVPRAGYQLARCRAAVEVDNLVERHALGSGDACLHLLPAVAFSRRDGLQRIRHTGCCAAGDGRWHVHRGLAGGRHFEQLHLHVGQGQAAGVDDVEVAVVGIAADDVAGDVAVACLAQAVDIERRHHCAQALAGIAGTHVEVAHLAFCHRPLVGEASLCVGGDVLHLAGAFKDEVEVKGCIGGAVARHLSAEDDLLTLVVDGLVGADGHGEGRDGLDADIARGVIIV